MAKVRFLFGSVTDAPTLTATSGTPSRMQTGGAARTWRSDDLAEQNVTAPFGETVSVDVIHLENINTDQTLVVQFSDDNFATIKHAELFSAWAKDLTYKAATLWLTGTSGGGMFLDDNGDSIADDGGDTLICDAYNVPLPVSASYMRIVVADSTNADGYVEIGRLMAGKYYVASNSENVSVGKSFDYKERSQLIETRGGQYRAMERDPQRKVMVDYEFLHETDATELDDDTLPEYLRTVGQRKDVLISVFPDESTDRERLHTIVGRITRRSDIRGNFLAVTDGDTKLYSRMNFEITEAL